MPYIYASPCYKNVLFPEGSACRFQVPVEKWRMIAYAFFWFFVGFSFVITRLFVVDILAAGAPPGTPTEQLGCGAFNRNSGTTDTRFDLSFGQGFDYHSETHLTDNFGFANICTNWDYSPSRELTAMIFPLFEYSLMIYLTLDVINTRLSYKRGEIPAWFWTFSKILYPLNVVLCTMFRQIFVQIAYESTKMHTFGFLCLQTGIMLVAIQNVMYVVMTGQSYTKVGLTASRTALYGKLYLAINLFITFFKIQGTIYIVRTGVGSDFYNTPSGIGDLVWGRIIDVIWMLFNAVIPLGIAYVRMIHETLLDFEISLPAPTYASEPVGETEPLNA